MKDSEHTPQTTLLDGAGLVASEWFWGVSNGLCCKKENAYLVTVGSIQKCQKWNLLHLSISTANSIQNVEITFDEWITNADSVV